MEFNFKNYKLFCYDFNLKPDRFTNLKIFKEYCNGNYDIIFSIVMNKEELLKEIMFMYCEEKAKDKIKELEKQLKSQAETYQKALDETMSEKMDLEDIINKAVCSVRILSEIISEQPSKDAECDKFILKKLNSILYVLKGDSNEYK